uniref:SGL domain-containing protein n=1 Tax=Macrostomum lignano TaxID=282301 RepID=A0A1I8JM10_9PLAT
SGASIAPAPQPCLFASFDPAEGRRHLLAASLPEAGRRLLRCEADIDWDDWLVGIQCRCTGDGSQRLYVAQESVLTALDLAGRPVWSSRPVSATAGCRLAGLTASPTEPRLFTYDRVGRRVLSVAMATGTWAIAVQLVEFADWLVSGLAAGPDGQLVLSDYCSGRLRFVSADPAPGRLDASYPAEDATEFQLAAPAGLALDLAGRVFQADSAGHVVRVIDGVGQRLLATLGGLECGAGQDSGDEDAFRCPIGVALLAAGDGRSGWRGGSRRILSRRSGWRRKLVTGGLLGRGRRLGDLFSSRRTSDSAGWLASRDQSQATVATREYTTCFGSDTLAANGDTPVAAKNRTAPDDQRSAAAAEWLVGEHLGSRIVRCTVQCPIGLLRAAVEPLGQAEVAQAEVAEPPLVQVGQGGEEASGGQTAEGQVTGLGQLRLAEQPDGVLRAPPGRTCRLPPQQASIRMIDSCGVARQARSCTKPGCPRTRRSTAASVSTRVFMLRSPHIRRQRCSLAADSSPVARCRMCTTLAKRPLHDSTYSISPTNAESPGINIPPMAPVSIVSTSLTAYAPPHDRKGSCGSPPSSDSESDCESTPRQRRRNSTTSTSTTSSDEDRPTALKARISTTGRIETTLAENIAESIALQCAAVADSGISNTSPETQSSTEFQTNAMRSIETLASPMQPILAQNLLHLQHHQHLHPTGILKPGRDLAEQHNIMQAAFKASLFRLLSGIYVMLLCALGLLMPTAELLAKKVALHLF